MGYATTNKYDLLEVAPIFYLQNFDAKYNESTFLNFILAIVNIRDSADLNCFTKYISQYSAVLKHYSFKCEREVRILLALKDDSIFDDNIGFREIEPHYLHFTLNDLIKSITIGPCVSDDVKTKIIELLKNKKIDENKIFKISFTYMKTND